MKLLNNLLFALPLLGLALAPTQAGAQVAVPPRSTMVTLGVGFQGNRFQASTWLPSYHILAEYAVLKNATVGVAGTFYREQVARSSWATTSSFGVRGAYYVNSLLKRDAKKVNYYVGLSALYFHYKYTDFAATEGKIYLPVHLGARRLFTEHYGANLEVSFNDMGSVNVGLFRKW